VIELGGVQVLGGKVEVGRIAIKAVVSRSSHFENVFGKIFKISIYLVSSSFEFIFAIGFNVRF
jgi:hypothetical protein